MQDDSEPLKNDESRRVGLSKLASRTSEYGERVCEGNASESRFLKVRPTIKTSLVLSTLDLFVPDWRGIPVTYRA